MLKENSISVILAINAVRKTFEKKKKHCPLKPGSEIF